MNLRDTLATAWQAICRQPYVGAQAFFGLAIGIAALMVTLALRPGGIGDDGAHLTMPSRLEIFSENIYAPAEISAARQISTLTTADVAAIRRLDGTSSAAASVLQFSRLNYAGSSLPVSVYGVDADYFAVHGWTLAGAFSARDFRDANTAVMLGSGLSARVFGEVDPAGKTIQLGDANFHISGVVSADDASKFFGDYATAVFASRKSRARKAPASAQPWTAK